MMGAAPAYQDQVPPPSVIAQMSANSSALLASTRFGFAARGEDLSTIGRDPRGWALAQLAHPPAPLSGDLPSSATMVAAEFQMRQAKDDPETKRLFRERVQAI